MKIELSTLAVRHPELDEDRARDLELHAATALQRWHAPGVAMEVQAFGERCRATISWRARAAEGYLQLDVQDVTELGAEALALLHLHETRGWVVFRRLQRFESGDWLLVDDIGRLIALEVSGTDTGNIEVRLREKLLQVASCEEAATQVACVVRFVEPMARAEANEAQ